MKKFKLLSITALMCGLSFVTTAQTVQQASCAPATKREHQYMYLSVMLDRVEAIKDLSKKYCYSVNYKSSEQLRVQADPFYVKSLTALQAFEPTVDLLSIKYQGGQALRTNVSAPMNVDMLSFFLLSEEIFEEYDIRRKKEPIINNESAIFRDVYKGYDNYLDKISDKDLSNLKIGLRDSVERDKVVNYLLDLRAKQKNVSLSSGDFWGNNASTYALIKGNYDVLLRLKNENKVFGESFFFRKNKDRVTLSHLLFNLKTKDQDKIKKLNDLFLNDSETTMVKLGTTLYDGLNYFEFAEVMKDKNPDLYTKLRAKFPTGRYVNKYTPQAKEMMESKMNYINVLREKINNV